MKTLTFITLACLSAFLCKSQESINNLNNNIKDIVFYRILGDFDVNYPILTALPVNPSFQIIQNNINEVLFIGDSPDLGFLIENSGISRLELYRSLNTEFIPLLKADTSIRFLARKKKKILYSIQFKKEGPNEAYTYALADGSLVKEIIYQNGQLMSLNVIKPDLRYMLINEMKDKSLYSQIVFNSKTGKYTLTDYFYQNNILTRKVLYQTSGSRLSRDIMKTWNYNYDTDGKIISVTGLDYTGVKSDSINYFYSETKLNSIVTYEKDAQSTIYYLPESGLMSDYLYKRFENTLKLHYEYNTEGKISNVLVTNSKKPTVESFTFEYNSSSNLVSIKKFVNQKISNDMIFKKQFIFSYNSDNILTALLIAKKKGKIKKELSYEINYMK